jgi:acyl-CoA synthetase (AMP-forming)/AMP-acid ligase II
MSVGNMLDERTDARDERRRYERERDIVSIASALRAAAEVPIHGNHDAGVVLLDGHGKEQRLRYGDLWAAARVAANGLRAHGVGQGDRIIVLLPTSVDYVVTVCAAIIAGALPCTIAAPTTRSRAEEALRYLVPVQEKLTPALFVAQPNVRSMIAEHPAFDPARAVTPDDLQHHGAADLDTLPLLGGVDPLHIQLTSGSTNRPKGVLLRNENVIANMKAIAHAIDFMPVRDSGLSWLPLYHDMGFIQLMMAIYYQTTIVLMTPASFIRNPLSWLHNIGRFGVALTAAPTFAYSLCIRKADPEQLHGLDLHSWRRSFMGAEAVPYRVIQEFKRTFEPYGLGEHTLYPCYGMAETVLATTLPIAVQPPNRRWGFVSTDRVDAALLRSDGRAEPVGDDTGTDVLEIVGTGHAAQGLDVCVQDGAGQSLPDRMVGEICVRGTSLMAGYFDDEATAAAMTDGWFRTGDTGYLVDGELYVLGRIKELIIVRGRNYQPDDIEDVLEQHDGVRKGYSVAFAVNNVDRGTDDVVALVETRVTGEAQTALARQIQQSLQSAFGFLADALVFVPHGTLPRTTSGKRQRVLAQQMFRDGLFRKDGE